MPLVHLTADASPEEVAAAIGSDGAVIVDAVVPDALLQRIEAELRPYLDATPTGPDDFSGDRTRRTPRRWAEPRAQPRTSTRTQIRPAHQTQSRWRAWAPLPPGI